MQEDPSSPILSSKPSLSVLSQSRFPRSVSSYPGPGFAVNVFVPDFRLHVDWFRKESFAVDHRSHREGSKSKQSIFIRSMFFSSSADWYATNRSFGRLFGLFWMRSLCA